MIKSQLEDFVYNEKEIINFLSALFKESIDVTLDEVNGMSKDLSKKLEKTDGIFTQASVFIRKSASGAHHNNAGTPEV